MELSGRTVFGQVAWWVIGARFWEGVKNVWNEKVDISAIKKVFELAVYCGRWNKWTVPVHNRAHMETHNSPLSKAEVAHEEKSTCANKLAADETRRAEFSLRTQRSIREADCGGWSSDWLWKSPPESEEYTCVSHRLCVCKCAREAGRVSLNRQ